MASLQTHIEAIERYRDGLEPGRCTRAILENDLFGAAARADPTTRFLLWDIAWYIAENLPEESYGSRAKVEAWLKGGHLQCQNQSPG